MFLGALITPAFTNRNCPPPNLAAGYFLKLGLPTLTGLGDEK